MKTSPTTLKGIGILLLALACFSFMDTFTKKVTAQAPILMVIWTRYLIQALVTTAFILPKMGRSVLITEHPWTQVSRGALLMLTTGLAVLSLQFLPVGEFSAIVMTTPLLVTLFASRWLGEHVSHTRIALVAGGFLGTLLIVRPGSSFFGWPMIFPLLLVVANAGFQLLTSKMAQTEKSMTTHFYSVWTGAVLSSVVVYWAWATIEDTQLWLEIIAIAVAGALGHFLLIVAFEKSPAATLMPYMYLQIGLSMLGGWLLFGHVPDHWSVLGIITIAACGLAGAMLTVVEARRKRLL